MPRNLLLDGKAGFSQEFYLDFFLCRFAFLDISQAHFRATATTQNCGLISAPSYCHRHLGSTCKRSPQNFIHLEKDIFSCPGQRNR